MTANQINFKIYPTTNRVPGVFAEIDPSLANTGQVNQRTLILGQKLSSGSYAAGVPIISSGVGDCQNGAGLGSMLALELQQYRGSDSFGEVWLLPLADDPSAAAATEALTVTGPATQSGDIYLYIGHSPTVTQNRIICAVNNGDSANTMAANLTAAINAQPYCPVSAVNTGAPSATVTLTAKNKGLAGNAIDVRANYAGALGGEVFPTGVGITYGNPVGNGSLLSGGTVNPSLTTPLSNIAGDQTFDFIVCPYTDSTSLNAIQAFLNDTAGRWSWEQELFGGAWTAYRGTLSALTSFGTSRNDQHVSAMGFYDSPTPDWLWAAEYAANAAASLRADPSLPIQTLQLQVDAPPLPSQFNISQRNTLLYDGISTFVVNDAGQVSIDRGCTTYQLNPAGAPDDSYLDVETMYTLQFCIRDMRIFLQTIYAQMKLVADGTRISAGSNMCTSQTVLASAISRYRVQAQGGLAQNPDIFADAASAQNAGGGLVKLLLPYQLANQLRQIAMLIQFTKP